MKIAEIYTILDKIAPFELQESWDNSGVLIGTFEDEFSKTLLSIDLDMELVESVENGTLIITHHPLIFKGLKKLDFSKYPANIIQKMIKKDLKLISLHTNFDKAILNRYVMEKVLGFQVSEESDFLLVADVEMSGDEVLKLVKEKFSPTKWTELPKKIKRIGLTTGAGGSLIPLALEKKCDIFLTGDLKYHETAEAKIMGLSLIDIGHFESERFFGEALKPHLQNLDITVEIRNSKNPFERG